MTSFNFVLVTSAQNVGFPVVAAIGFPITKNAERSQFFECNFLDVAHALVVGLDLTYVCSREWAQVTRKTFPSPLLTVRSAVPPLVFKRVKYPVTMILHWWRVTGATKVGSLMWTAGRPHWAPVRPLGSGPSGPCNTCTQVPGCDTWRRTSLNILSLMFSSRFGNSKGQPRNPLSVSVLVPLLLLRG